MSREVRFGQRLNIMFDILVHLHKGLSLLSKYIITKEFSSYSAEIDIAKTYCLGNNVRFYSCQTSGRIFEFRGPAIPLPLSIS
jgi:hypothetical protein